MAATASDLKVTVVTEPPTGLSTMAKAALPAIPGLSMLPGIAKRGGALPQVALRREAVAIDPAHVAQYADVCGFPAADTVPLSYPHMLAFGLQMQILTASNFPFPAIGSVHLSNTIHQLRRIKLNEELDVEVRPENLRAHDKGTMFDLVSEISADGDLVWESVSTYLRRGKPSKDLTKDEGGEPLNVVDSNGLTWKLPGNLGRSYAAVAGDYNPIHLTALSAKALGFRRQIAHGMWTKARCIAALDGRIAPEAEVRVDFKIPIFLPGKVNFGSQISENGIDFSVLRPRDGAPHVVGKLTNQ